MSLSFWLRRISADRPSAALLACDRAHTRALRERAQPHDVEQIAYRRRRGAEAVVQLTLQVIRGVDSVRRRHALV